jgi:serine/threonine-protein phosphatase 2A activator
MSLAPSPLLERWTYYVGIRIWCFYHGQIWIGRKPICPASICQSRLSLVKEYKLELKAVEVVNLVSANMSLHSVLKVLDPLAEHKFVVPLKKIHDGPDLSFFLTSLAYRDLVTFVLQLNHSMVPRILENEGDNTIQTWKLGSDAVTLSKPVRQLQKLIERLNSLVDEVPPDTGPRRFGNVSFRKWYNIVEEKLPALLQEFVPLDILSFAHKADDAAHVTALEELQIYLLGSFGSPPRLDYGTGHELSFLAFLGALWKLGLFNGQEPGAAERGIVIGIFEPYLNLVRRVIQLYTLEPAGSHGVWGLDDNSFLPYIFGSAQLAPAIHEADPAPVEGSVPEAPEPSSVANRSFVQRERATNMYFSAVGFIFDVKRGPFGEHSPMLHDISGITAGWGKINKGMIKMYNAEVLSKFPVVQHFPFGSLFLWEKDPDADPQHSTTHTTSQPLREPPNSNVAASRAQSWQNAVSSGASVTTGLGTPAPWATIPPNPARGMVDGVTRAPWAPASKAPPPTSSRKQPGQSR